jgi:hypothetical protein
MRLMPLMQQTCHLPACSAGRPARSAGLPPRSRAQFLIDADALLPWIRTAAGGKVTGLIAVLRRLRKPHGAMSTRTAHAHQGSRPLGVVQQEGIESAT